MAHWLEAEGGCLGSSHGSRLKFVAGSALMGEWKWMLVTSREYIRYRTGNIPSARGIVVKLQRKGTGSSVAIFYWQGRHGSSQ